jgi:hypothetical protein
MKAISMEFSSRFVSFAVHLMMMMMKHTARQLLTDHIGGRRAGGAGGAVPGSDRQAVRGRWRAEGLN